MTRRRDLALAVFLVIVVAGGVTFDFISNDVGSRERSPIEGDRFRSRAVFCPPAIGGNKSNTAFTIASGEGTASTVGLAPIVPEPQDIPAGEILVQESLGGDPLEVVGYGSEVVATAATSKPSTGAGAARCAPRASGRWYFAAGSASIDADERILVYNPFPDEAVVTLALFTPGGERTRTGLQDVAVPAHEWRSIPINEVIQVKKTLAVEVVARRGRVVAWREMVIDSKDRPDGIEYDLGAPAPALKWYFPDGAVGEGANETLTILNPGEREATVSIVLATPVETLTPPDLVEYPIPPRSQQVISIEEFAGGNKDGIASVSAIVTSVNGEPIVAERTIAISSDEMSGESSELGTTTTSASWFLGPAVLFPENDAVAIMAPGGDDVTLDISILVKGSGAISPPELQGLKIRAGSRIKVPIATWTRGKTAGVIVTGDSPVVAERTAYAAGVNDIASLMGIPIRTLP